MALLKAIKGANPGQIIPLESDSMVLGRHPECDIVLDAGAVSRQHARITQAGGRYFIEDLHSRNGTFLNGEVIDGRRALNERDELRICDLIFVFHQGPADAAPGEADADNSEESGALLVDDVRQTTTSTIMSKLSAGSKSMRLEANPEAKLRALIEISQNLGKAINVHEVLPKVLDSLFSIFIQADRGFVILIDPVSHKLIPKAVKYRRQEDQRTARISRTVINEVVNSKEAILSADAAADARFGLAESIVDFHIRSMMCAPLVASDGKVLGAIQVDTLDQRSKFNRNDLDVLASVAWQAAYAVENAQLHEAAIREQAMERELAVAHRVQRGFLPAAPPNLADYTFFDFYEPAHHVGGDYFDYIPLPDGRIAVVVADVSGKGVAASLLMARLSAEARFSLASDPSPVAALQRLNDVFCGNGWEDRFITLAIVVLDPVRHELTIVNAGHLPVLLCAEDGEYQVLAEKETGLPLGIVEGYPYQQCVVSCAPRHCVMLYTDGITEAMNAKEELYGFERLTRQVSLGLDATQTFGQRILDDVKKFVGGHPQSDDMCLTCFGRFYPSAKDTGAIVVGNVSQR